MKNKAKPTNKQTADDAPLFPARTFPAVYLAPGDPRRDPPAPPMQMTDEQQKTLDKIKADAAAAHERAGAGIEAAFEKAHWLDKIFTRIQKTLSRPDADHLEDDAVAMIHAVQEQAKTQGPEAIALAFDCLSLGVKLGRVRDTREIVEETLNEKAEAERKAKEEAERKRLERHAKNNLPKWGEDERRFYDAKIQDLIREGMSNREIAKAIPTWAEGNPNVNGCRIPGDSALQTWAAKLREKKKRRNRAH